MKGLENNSKIILSFIFFSIIFSLSTVSADNNTYIADISFTLPESFYNLNEMIELKGSLLLKNFSSNGSLVSSSYVSGAYINITIFNSTLNVSNYNLTTDSSGLFYTKSSYYTTALNITAPGVAGEYNIRASYIDPNQTTSYSQVSIIVVNKSIDKVRVSTNKATYNPGDSISILAEAFYLIGDKSVFVSNISVNGSIRNSTSKDIISLFNCTTDSSGKCSVIKSAPNTYGDYIIEINNFKSFSHFGVVPFIASIYMKDELGKSVKNIFSTGEQASVEVSVVTNSSSETYSFSGYIADSDGNVVKTIESTTLSTNNSYTNKFIFTVDGLTFSYGTYYAYVTLSKQGGGKINLISPFEVSNWKMDLIKKDTGSGFEYDYTSFINKTLRFEIYPKYRANGSVIPAINNTSFSVNLIDKLNNNLLSANVTWNSTCAKEGCYEFNITSPVNAGQYFVRVTLSNEGEIKKTEVPIYVVESVLTAQSTNLEGNIKELFGTNEFVYLSLNTYNLTIPSINLSDAEISIVRYMNGTELSYSNVSNFDQVNGTNSVNEWAWNSTLQRIKMDTPKAGGVYNIIIFGNNKTTSGSARFIVNPYDICSSSKNTPGTISSGSAYYYVWQFKTTDTVYFELKAVQANNPAGRATASNFTTNSSSGTYGLGSACSINTQTQQPVTNATVSITKVVNTQNGAEYSLNTSQSTCAASDTQGSYTCTVAPAGKWDGGTYSVEMKVTGPEGSSDIVYGLFEARAFYLYGYSSTWQNSPDSNVSLTIRMYEAGNNWWGNYGSGGLSGTVKLEKVEYMGKDGEYLWPPIDYSYNVSSVNTTTITTGSGTMTLPVNYTKKGTWDNGNYRLILKGTDSSGNIDYGYVWFIVKQWDGYGNPIECSSGSCSYKSYFNSKENVTLYIKIGNAGAWNSGDSGGQSLKGNISIGIKKIQDCRKWPCKDLNSTEYTSSLIYTNASSPWYWGSAVNTSSKYLISINKSNGKWGTGWYSVILDINGTETGYAWFNTIAFYVDTKPTDVNGTNWKYSIKPRESMYYNVTVSKGYSSGGFVSNRSQYVNATINDAVIRTWDYSTYTSKEYNYPEDINITIINSNNTLQINGSALVNISYRNGSWPNGYYNGELILRNNENETSTGWLWFNVQPFRVDISSSSYEIDSDSCLNGTSVNIKVPDWSSNSIITGNYSITSVYENIWTGSSNTLITYTNYTNSTFNGAVNATFCPPNSGWGAGSWGGYHYLNILVRDNSDNSSQTGWLSFRAVPYKISYSVSGGNDKRTNQNVNVTVSLTKASNSNTLTTGNISRIYQWRYDSSTSYSSTLETYSYTVYTNGSTCTSSSTSCWINGSATIVITAPSNGWRTGGNYLYADLLSSSGSYVQDYSGFYINGLQAYNGWFDNVDSSGNWVNGYAPTGNVTLRITVRNSTYNGVSASIDSIQYASYGSGCYSDWCSSYTTATWSFVSGGSGTQLTSNGSGIITIAKPSGGWTKGSYTVKASVSGSEGSSTITGNSFNIKDLTPPNITISSPTLNQTITSQSISFSATTTENSVCNVYSLDYGHFKSWYCPNASSSNYSSNPTSLINSCNSTYYGFNNSTSYQTEYISRNYYSFYNVTDSNWSNGESISTGGTSHSYTMNVSKWKNQDYGMYASCYDEDNNYAITYTAIHVNKT